MSSSIPDPAPSSNQLRALAAALRALGSAADQSFAQRAGSTLRVCGDSLGADSGFVIETTQQDAAALAGFGPDGSYAAGDELREAAAPIAQRWVNALLEGGLGHGSDLLAQPFSLDGRPVGIVVFTGIDAADAPTHDQQLQLVQACAQWVGGEWTGLIESRRRQELNEQRHRAVTAGTNDGLFEWNLITNRVEYSGRWKQMLGFPLDEPLHQADAWFSLVDSSDLAQLEADLAMCLAGQTSSLRNQHRMLNAEGQTRWMLCRGELLADEDGTPLRLIGSLSDTTEFKLAEEKLRHAAEHDKLTDLPNRATLHTRLQQAIRRHRLTGGRRKYALMFLDFDRFKVINDSLGHDAGDQLLVQIAGRLRSQIRLSDTPARIGGDEFVLLLEGIDDFDIALRVGDRLLEAFDQPFLIDGNEVRSTASIGIVEGSTDYESADDVIRDADSAMYQAKRLGKARYTIFDQDMKDESLKRLVLERELRTAIGTDDIFMCYQPILAVGSGAVVGFESLVRWQHPEHGTVRPDQFIHIAEETGLIVPLGEWILQRSCQDLRRIQDATGRPELTMNVNLSRRQLVQPGLPQTIARIVADAGLEPHQVRLEITESVIMDARESLTPILEEVRGLGFQLAMDDFGTGYSSLACLHLFPIDVLKLDRSFVMSLDEHLEFAAVIKAVVTLAHTLGLSVVAEGIETTDQLDVLRTLKCDRLQGYLFARPMPLEQTIDHLSRPTDLRRSA